jgi:hypothetical protein
MASRPAQDQDLESADELCLFTRLIEGARLRGIGWPFFGRSMARPYTIDLRERVVEAGRRGGRRLNALRSPRARRSNSCSAGTRPEASRQCRPRAAFRRSRSMRPAGWLSLPSSQIRRWGRGLRRCTSSASPAVVPLSGVDCQWLARRPSWRALA